MKRLFVYFIAFFLSLTFCLNVNALPKTTVLFSTSDAGFSQAKVTNDTQKTLACYVSIDGYKVKFQLGANASSQWIKATDRRFNYRNFSTWCDYLSLHPDYQRY